MNTKELLRRARYFIDAETFSELNDGIEVFLSKGLTEDDIKDVVYEIVGNGFFYDRVKTYLIKNYWREHSEDF